jgi:hypothetical protein
MTNQTKVLPNEFNGKSLFSVFEVDENGEKTNDKGYPIVSFGLKKAKALLDHVDELKDYVERNS